MNKSTLLLAIGAATIILAVVIVKSMTAKTQPEFNEPGLDTPSTRSMASTLHSGRDADATENGSPEAPPPHETDQTDSANATILESIHEASIQYEPEQIPVISRYLVHPDQEVRTAALNGLIVLGERAAANNLREAAKQLEDPREAVTYLDAADYLELPSYRFNKRED